MKLQATAGRVIVKEDKVEEKTASGIIIAGTKMHRTQEGIALHVGKPLVTYSGEKVETNVKEGDRIIFALDNIVDIEEGDEKVVVVPFNDILAIK